jgi:membrane protein implicated in regulation of membrane protease activity
MSKMAGKAGQFAAFLIEEPRRAVTGYLFVALAALVAVAGWRFRHRFRRETRSGVTDEIVHQIETLGRVDAEDVEPLDLEQVRAEEDEFWAETWDEPQENW